jgi:hypothetical protein
MADAKHIAQVNVGILKAPLDSPEVAEFVAWLAPINAIADQAPGFVWRLQTEAGDATALRIFADTEALLVNMSVWESVESLVAYVYRSPHIAVLRRRREWFEKMVQPHLALWWVAPGHRPTISEAEDRLRRIREVGPTAYAFSFEKAYPASGPVSEAFDARALIRHAPSR